MRDAITPRANPVTPIESDGLKWERELSNVVDTKPDPYVEAHRALELARADRRVIGQAALARLDPRAFAALTGTRDLSSAFGDPTLLGSDTNSGFGHGRWRNDSGGNVGLGWGTIGTSLHSGIGTGVGYGITRGRIARSRGPTTTLGTPVVEGDLDRAIVRRYLRRNIQKLTYCYEKELLAKPALEGTVTASFTILDSGSVSGATAGGVDPAVSSCVTAVIGGVAFPKPKGGPANVSVTLAVRPP